MKHLWLAATLLLLAPSVCSADSDKSSAAVVVKPVVSTNVTASGQPIVLAQKNVRVIVTTFVIAKGATLPEHRHPFARYAYVTAGKLRVTNTETGKSDVYKAGDFIVEAIGQWHKAANIGGGVVKLVVVDQVEGDEGNTELRK
jgi:quercetin dioxygenase-like cupin family protein